MKMLDKLTRGVFAKAEVERIGKMMALHCDKRIANARKAIRREEKYLFKLLRARNTGGVMAEDVKGAFRRLQTALDKPIKMH